MDNLNALRASTPDTHYVVEKHCWNCKSFCFLTIEKGRTVDEYLAEHPLCDYCGCKIVPSFMDAEIIDGDKLGCKEEQLPHAFTVLTDKPKRHRRTKAEMEAARASITWGPEETAKGVVTTDPNPPEESKKSGFEPDSVGE
jgi:hypothetical protein